MSQRLHAKVQNTVKWTLLTLDQDIVLTYLMIWVGFIIVLRIYSKT